VLIEIMPFCRGFLSAKRDKRASTNTIPSAYEPRHLIYCVVIKDARRLKPVEPFDWPPTYTKSSTSKPKEVLLTRAKRPVVS